MKMIKTSFIAPLLLVNSLLANDFKEAKISVDKADKIVNVNKGKYINESELKNEKVKTLQQNIQIKQKDLGTLTNIKNKALSDISSENKKAIMELETKRNLEIETINDKYNRQIEQTNNMYKEKEHTAILSYNQNTAKKAEEIDLYKKEIVGLEKIEKVVQEKENTQPVVLSNLTVIYKYIERNNHLDRAMLDISLIDSIKLYIHIVKNGLPYAIKKRSLDYSLSLAEKTEGIDLEYFQITLKNEKLDDIESMMIDINEYLSKNNNILLEK